MFTLILHCLSPRYRGSHCRARDFNVLWRRRLKNITTSRYIPRQKQSLNLTIIHWYRIAVSCMQTAACQYGADQVKFCCQYTIENTFALRYYYFPPIMRLCPRTKDFETISGIEFFQKNYNVILALRSSTPTDITFIFSRRKEEQRNVIKS